MKTPARYALYAAAILFTALFIGIVVRLVVESTPPDCDKVYGCGE